MLLCVGLHQVDAAGSDEGRGVLCPPPPQKGLLPVGVASGGMVEAEADRLEGRGGNEMVLEGEVDLRAPGRRLSADRVEYDPTSGVARASGQVDYREEGLEIENASSAEVSMDGEGGRFSNSTYRLPQRNARGQAAEVDFQHGGEKARLKGVSYTTCPFGRDDWLLNADRVDLDYPANEGVARNASLSVVGLPALYTPWISFPLDSRRKTGLLVPRFGYSEQSGLDLQLPYYLNIAPDRDATISPRLMSRRGLMLEGEYRWLGRRNHGEWNAAILDDHEYGDLRGKLSLQHRAEPFERISTELNLNRVSDRYYLDELGGNFSLATTSHLESVARVGYQGDWWRADGMIQGFQSVVPGMSALDKPYRRLPELRLHAGQSIGGGLALDADAELVRFDHALRDEGDRLRVTPRISYTRSASGYQVTSSLTAHHIRWRLEESRFSERSPTLSVPGFSFGGELFFERAVDLSGFAAVQTLEPAIHYLRVPYRDQSDLPLFDSAVYDFGMTSLARENRFSGGDRVADANQLAIALTSRLIDDRSGREWLRMSGGQIIYFDPRRVRLPGERVDLESERSDLLFEMEGRASGGWMGRVGWQWGTGRGETSLAAAHLRYQPAPRTIINLGYRYRDQLIDQSDLSFYWPLSGRWSVIGRWNHSWREQQPLEQIAGFEYRSCCWALRMVARSHVDESFDEIDRGLFMQVELSGLGRIGNGLESLLEQGVLGYHSD